MKIYDDIFRTLCEKNTHLLIFLINEIFKSGYRPDEKIELLSGEHHYGMESNVNTDGMNEIITDSLIKIRDKLYHIECQSNPDGCIIIRMIEYDFHIALENAVNIDGTYKIEFPYSAVLYLRHNKNTAGNVTMEIKFPDGQTISYAVPVVKVQDYTDDEIISKHLYFLVPYYIMRYENAGSGDVVNEICKGYKKLLNGMTASYNAGEIDGYDMLNIVDLTKMLTSYLFKNNNNVKKEVEKVMSGQIIETSIDKKLKDSYEQGIAQGMAQGFGLMGELFLKLEEDGKITEISHAARDLDYCKKLLKEYNII